MIDQNDAATWCNKGLALRKLTRYEEAIQAYDRALEIDQNAAVAWCSKGVALYYLQRYAEAIQSYDRALAIDPHDALALRGRKTADALKAARRSAVVNGNIEQNDVAAWLTKGNALHNIKRYEEAIQAYDRALAIEPHDELALRGRKAAKEALRAILFAAAANTTRR